MRSICGFALAFVVAFPVAAKDVVWNGYLFEGADGRLHIGQEVIAMGVIGGWDYRLSAELSEKYSDLASNLGNQHFFWNYGGLLKAAKSEGKPFAKVPRVLVRIRGDARAESEEPFSQQLEMKSGRLVAVEFIDEPWLAAWAELAALDEAIAMQFGAIEERSKKQLEELVPKVVAQLEQMLARSAITEAQRRRARTFDVDARVSRAFQFGVVQRVRRWLDSINDEHDLGLDLTARLGEVPPTWTEVQEWFLAAADEKAFRAKITERWSGDLDELQLSYYEKDAGRTWYELVPVGEALRRWSDEDFLRHQKNTRDVVERRR